jgi:hypothetical protein
MGPCRFRFLVEAKRYLVLPETCDKWRVAMKFMQFLTPFWEFAPICVTVFHTHSRPPFPRLVSSLLVYSRHPLGRLCLLFVPRASCPFMPCFSFIFTFVRSVPYGPRRPHAASMPLSFCVTPRLTFSYLVLMSCVPV